MGRRPVRVLWARPSPCMRACARRLPTDGNAAPGRVRVSETSRYLTRNPEGRATKRLRIEHRQHGLHKRPTVVLPTLPGLPHHGRGFGLVELEEGDLKGFPGAFETIYPNTLAQTCVAHLIGDSLMYMPGREREQIARDLKRIYTAVGADVAQAALQVKKLGARFPVITRAWLNGWEYIDLVPSVSARAASSGLCDERDRSCSAGNCAKRSTPKDTSPTKGPPESSSTSHDQLRAGMDANPNWTTALLAFKIHFGDRLSQ